MDGGKRKMEFKRQTNRSTKMDKTTNINLFMDDFSFGVVNSEHWGDFTKDRGKNPLIQITLDNKRYEFELTKFKVMLKEVLNDVKNE